MVLTTLLILLGTTSASANPAAGRATPLPLVLLTDTQGKDMGAVCLDGTCDDMRQPQTPF